jgi:ABC-type branched-subunit amino acid transport system substrate-binding protein
LRTKSWGVMLTVLAVVVAACGSRLTSSQTAALNSSTAVVSAGNAPVAGPSGSIAPGVTTAGPNPASGATGGTSATGGSTGSSTGSVPITGGLPTPTTLAATATAAATAPVRVAASVCAGPASGPGVSASEIDVGNVATLTGPVPGLFIGAQHGVTAFAAYLNSIGGICGRRLVVKAADDNLDVSQNATATQSIAGSVMAFVGSFSGDDQGGAAVLQSDGVPDIGEALSAQRFGLPNNFSPEPKPPGWNLAPYVYFKQKYPQAASHMAVLIENQATAAAEALDEDQALESIGYKFVYTDSNIEPTQTDYSADAQAMKAHGALGVVYQATAPFYAGLARAMQDAGLTMPFANYAANAYDAAFVADAGSAANGAIIYSEEAMYQGEDAASVPMVALFDKWYEALYGAPPDLFATYGWMSGLLFIEGLNLGGGITRANLLNGLRNVTAFNAGGLVGTDSPANKKPPYCYLIIDVVKGKFVRDPVDPPTSFDCANTPDYYFAKT